MTILKWLNTAAAIKVASLISLVYFSLATLGKTGSYWEAFETAIVFTGIWCLGRLSNKSA